MQVDEECKSRRGVPCSGDRTCPGQWLRRSRCSRLQSGGSCHGVMLRSRGRLVHVHMRLQSDSHFAPLRRRRCCCLLSPPPPGYLRAQHHALTLLAQLATSSRSIHAAPTPVIFRTRLSGSHARCSSSTLNDDTTSPVLCARVSHTLSSSTVSFTRSAKLGWARLSLFFLLSLPLESSRIEIWLLFDCFELDEDQINEQLLGWDVFIRRNVVNYWFLIAVLDDSKWGWSLSHLVAQIGSRDEFILFVFCLFCIVEKKMEVWK